MDYKLPWWAWILILAATLNGFAWVKDGFISSQGLKEYIRTTLEDHESRIESLESRLEEAGIE